ncbi:hypothetical protein ECG_07262 [Echinococcus granulosus]|uniref:Secreted protein n=1 Tax=Echinococcus granulosus TaxID=6210 RepID=A0A068WWB7_ECHGR|nr:hypothetical protein ECG_07262 [Echinococcus granulosus]CDS21931.1 hypothetical protein EgrG_000073400 [Echinococcus granulosus]
MSLLNCLILLLIPSLIDGRIRRGRNSDGMFRDISQKAQAVLGCGMQHELCYSLEVNCFRFGDGSAVICTRNCKLCMACVHLERGSIIRLCRPHNVVCCKSGDCAQLLPCIGILLHTKSPSS